MTDKATMWSSRDTAGTTYANALSALRSAFVTLAAYDKALANRDVGYGADADKAPIQSFVNGGVNAIPIGLLHAEFATDDLGGINRDVEAQAATYLSDLQAG